MHGVKRPTDQRRTARLTPETYATLGEALRALETEKANGVGLAAIRLLVLSGCRRGEIEQLRWSEVDLDGCALRLVNTKEGASVRPLGKPARALLALLPRLKGCPFVLPRADRTTPPGGLGYTKATIGAMLGHSAGTVTGRYVHHLDAVRIAAADLVAYDITSRLDTN